MIENEMMSFWDVDSQKLTNRQTKQDHISTIIYHISEYETTDKSVMKNK